jgi:hypothetical protein
VAADLDVWQVRRLVQGCYDSRETAERMSQVELIGGREQGGSKQHPQQAIRLVYRLLDRILSPPPSAAAPAVAEGVADAGRLEGGGASGADGADGAASVQEVAQRVDGALRFLQDSYWDWLRLEWLPSIQVCC